MTIEFDIPGSRRIRSRASYGALSHEALASFARELNGAQVLSVYVRGASADATPQRTWRTRLSTELHGLERARQDAAAVERMALKSCIAAMDDVLATYPKRLGAPAVGAFVSTTGARHSASLPKSVPTSVSWGRGLRVGPYVCAVPVERAAIVLAAGKQRALLYSFVRGALRRLETLNARTVKEEGALAERICRYAGADAWVLLLGHPATLQATRNDLAAVASRTRTVKEVVTRLSESEITELSRNAVAELERERQQRSLERIVRMAGADGGGALGVELTCRALADGRAEQLLFSPRFAVDAPDLLELALHAAFDRSASAEALSDRAAELLDRRAGGICALLRPPSLIPSPRSARSARHR
jgi:transcriptional regulator with XRE-family HTH domain